MRRRFTFTSRNFGRAAALALLLAGVGAANLSAEEAVPDLPDAAQTASLSAEQLQASINELTNSKDLPTEARERALDYYRTALSRLDAARAAAESAANYRKIVETGNAAVADIRRQLAAKKSATGSLTSNANLDYAELQQCLTEAQGDAATQRQRTQELDEVQRTSVMRYTGARADLEEERKKFDAADALSRSAQDVNEAPAVTKARQAEQLAARRLSTARVAMLEQELLSLPNRRRLLTAQRDLAALQLSAAERRVATLKRLLRERVLQNAQAELDEAQKAEAALAAQSGAMQEYARETTTLARQIGTLAHRLEKVDEEFAAASASNRKIYELRQSAQQLLEVRGGGAEFGQSLRELRDKLPLDAALSQQVAAGERAILDARILRIHLNEKLARIADDTEIDVLLRGPSRVGPPPPVPPETRAAAEPLLARRKQVLQRLLEANGQFLGRASELREALNELTTGTDNLSTLFDEKLMWLPSSPPLGQVWLQQVRTGLQWLFDADEWRGSVMALGAGFNARPALGVLVLLIFVILLLCRHRLLSALTQTRENSKSHSDAFNRVFYALTLSALLAAPIPILLFAAGRLMAFDPLGAPYAAAVGVGLSGAVLMGGALYGLRVLGLPAGVFTAHFLWSPDSSKRLRTNLLWLFVILVPAVFLMCATHATGNDEYYSGLGRLAFMLASAAFAVFLYRVLHPQRGVGLKLPADHTVARTSRFWFPVVIGIPVALGVFAAWGYFEPAVRVQLRLFLSAWVILAGVILDGLAMRWLVVAHERLTLRRSREENEQAQAAQAAQVASYAIGQAKPKLQFDKADLSAVNEQTRTLLSVGVGAGVLAGLWLVWSGIVPALAALDQIPIWSRMAGAELNQVVPVVSLLGLLKALTWLLLTVIAARNISGLLEIVALQRLPLESGTAYAIITISRYVIVAIGAIAIFHVLGVEWSGLQWIVASLSVGLGFGLQEIVANFIAGLILLFERRIRVGDTITVKDLTGTVSRIQIRATTVVDWDNREILVPNKSFITDHVINWTLSDPVTRLVLKVGIAYGSDTVRAQKVMLDTAKANPLVMEAPAPTVFFTGFGDSALNFEIRIFVRELSKRLPVTHELHVAIDRALRENGIEIPFPQLDLHIRKPQDDAAPKADPKKE